MAADNNYLSEEYNVMSKFADLSELQSSSDEEGTNVITKYSVNVPNYNKNGNKTMNDKPKEIIRPTIPKNDNSGFDLTQFQDLSLLESSSDEEAPKNEDNNIDNTESNISKTNNIKNSDDANGNESKSKSISNPEATSSSSSKHKHSRAALRRMEAKSNQQSTNKKSIDIKTNIATSVVKGAIAVTSKINSLQTKNKNKDNEDSYLPAYEILISMGFEEKISMEASKRCKGDINKCVSYIERGKEDKNGNINDNEEEEEEEKKKVIINDKNDKDKNDECPFRGILMFAMHLHLTGCILPKWMVNILGLFNDSNLKGCHEAASLGKQQRKLFLDTICKCREPDNFIFVDTDKSIEIIDENVKYSSFAIVNVVNKTQKYCELKSINGHKLNEKITDNHLMINCGVYLFFNNEYREKYLDYFLNQEIDNEHIAYFCIEYKLQQREHIKKILKLDNDIDSKYSEWFLSVYDKYLYHFDINDCYEYLSSNLRFWKELIFNTEAIKIQNAVDHTFIVKTIHHKQWIDDQRRDFCSFSKCNIKFGAFNRKHHCRCCGDIFCKIHCIKAMYRRNDKLELEPNRSLTQSPYYNHRGNENMLVDQEIYCNEREMRICPNCKEKKHLFVDVPHKHKFMECKCLKWNVNQIDFENKWKIFISSINNY